MPTSIPALLVSQDPLIVRDLRQLLDGTRAARLEVHGRHEKVLGRLGREPMVLIVHQDADAPPEGLRALLEAADRCHVPAAVVRHEGATAAPLTRACPAFELPSGLPALLKLIEAVHAESLRSRTAPAATQNPLDPVTQMLFGNDLDDQLARLRRVAGLPTTVLLTGETGSGKSLLTRFVHANSPRRNDPYLVVDCGTLSDHLIESEMFGHVRGAFTGAERDRQGKFAAAGTGTLVLDEINSLPLPLQAKLLRAVEERVFEPVGSNRSEPLRARLVAVSNVPLEDAVRDGRFRADLFYRLNVVEFRVPPLRERPGAVVPIAHQLLRASATAACQGVTAIAPEALGAMVAYKWPGNVRELRNVIEGASALAQGPIIQLADLPEALRTRKAVPARAPETAPPAAALAPSTDTEPAPPEPVAGDEETQRILEVLRKHNNNRRRAAAELQISRVSLYKKLHKFGAFVRKQRPPNQT